MWVRVRVQNARDARHPLWPHSSFTRYLAFPFPLLRPPFPFLLLLPRCSSQARRAHACVRAHVCVEQKRCARLVAVPCRCMQILSPNLVSARASVLRTKAARRVDGGARGKGSEGAINCGSSRGTVTGPRRRLRNCGCHDIDTSVPASNVPWKSR